MSLSDLDKDQLHDAVFVALWPHGPLEKDAAVRKVAEHLREAGLVAFQRLRADGPLYAQVLDAVESAVKAGLLDRPRRGYVRAVKADAQAFTAGDWRHALVASLGGEPADREDAIRAAAEWARENMGLDFARLRGDGHIVQGLRSGINSAIRRGEVARHGARRISRADSNGNETVQEDSENTDAVEADSEHTGAVVDDSNSGDHSTTITIEHSQEPRLINGNDSVLVLQFRSEDGGFEIQNLVAMVLGTALAMEADTPKGTAGWVFYLALERPHFEGLSTWLGIGKGVPLRCVDMLQKLLERLGHRVLREHAVVARHGLDPFVAVTDTGLDVPPVGPASPDDFHLGYFEVARIVRRPFSLTIEDQS
jgi:hypothetical protein